MVTIVRPRHTTLPPAPALTVGAVVVGGGGGVVMLVLGGPGLILGGAAVALLIIAVGMVVGHRSAARAAHRSSPRPPVFAARDLGTPFLEVRAVVVVGTDVADDTAPVIDPLDMTPVERPLPRDLDQPIADFDPGAILRDPLPAAETVVPLAEVAQPLISRSEPIVAGDRFGKFALAPVHPVVLRFVTDTLRRPAIVPEGESAVHGLLARLERDIASQPTAPGTSPHRNSAPDPVPTGGLTGTLSDLRQLAIGAR